MLAPFAHRTPEPAAEGQTTDANEHEAELVPMREAERETRLTLQEAAREFSQSPIATTGGATALASMVDPLVAAAFLALFIDALLFDGRLVRRRLEDLLAQQEDQISAFEEAVERNRPTVKKVTGLYNRAKTAAAARSKVTIVRRGVARIFGKAEPPPQNPAFPEASPEAVRDLPPSDPPTPNLPPPDCTTEDGQPGYLIAGTCYPLDTTSLNLDGKKDIDFAKLAAFRQLTYLDLDNTAITDLTPVAGLSGLQGLFLQSTQVSDLTRVKRLENLHRLVLPDGKELGDWQDNDKNRREIQDFLATL